MRTKEQYEKDYELQEDITTVKELERFITRNKDEMDSYQWFLVTKNSAFNLKVAESHSEYVDWEWISTFYDLSESFMTHHFDKLNMYCISRFQSMSFKFISDHKEELSIDQILFNNKIRMLKDFLKIQTLYDELSKDDKYKRIWNTNQKNSKLFCPPLVSNSSSMKTFKEFKEVVAEEIPKEIIVEKPRRTCKKEKVIPKIDIESMNKTQLREFLISKEIKVLYHDTMDILKEKASKVINNA